MLPFNFNPILATIGPFEIRYYGLVYVFGFLLVYFLLWHAIKKGKINLNTEELGTFILYLMLGVIIGSRAFEVLFWEPAYYFAHPLDIFAVWKGGMAFHGGLIGAVLATWLFCRKESIKSKITLAELADLLVIPAAFALALGRIANFVNGELVGTITNVPWCFNFPNYDGCRHPSQLYGALKRFIIVGILISINLVKKTYKPGFLFWWFIGLMGIGRFILDFYREDVRYLGLSLGQYLGVGMLLLTIIVFIIYYKKEFFSSKPR
ncbi:prolipoprotein diacylglyceryl transferase [Candidatus Woesearchaeota archaeon]|nr:prolipoprotein diacylglyceryl transferase [Candidatus Woesearchaeota archaeon]